MPEHPLLFSISENILGILISFIGYVLPAKPLNKRKQILFNMRKPQRIRVHMPFGNNHIFGLQQFIIMQPKKFTQNSFDSVSLNRVPAFFAYCQSDACRRSLFYKNNKKFCKMFFPLIIADLKLRSFQQSLIFLPDMRHNLPVGFKYVKDLSKGQQFFASKGRSKLSPAHKR